MIYGLAGLKTITQINLITRKGGWDVCGVHLGTGREHKTAKLHDLGSTLPMTSGMDRMLSAFFQRVLSMAVPPVFNKLQMFPLPGKIYEL